MHRLPLALAPVLVATPALAHLPPGAHGSVLAGATHPLFGADHVLAMVAVGLWAALLGGRALWAVPAAFVLAMVAGFALALAGMPLPAVEPMILASTVALGLAVALAVRVDARLCAAGVALVALFHGHAHGGELGEAAALRFGAGFALATGALHAAGIGLGRAAARLAARVGAPGDRVARGLGAATALGGLALALG